MPLIFTRLSNTSNEDDAIYEVTFMQTTSEQADPPIERETVEAFRQAWIMESGIVKVVHKQVPRIILSSSLRANHCYNGVAFNISVKEDAKNWVFITGFGVKGLLKEMSVFKLEGRDVNDYSKDKSQWILSHRNRYPSSYCKPAVLNLEDPVRIGPGQTCGFYIHSDCENDMGLQFRSCTGGIVLEDSCIRVHSGWSHTSPIPFDLERGYMRKNRVLSGGIHYEKLPIRWRPNQHFLYNQQKEFLLAHTAVLTSQIFPQSLLVMLVTFCGMDWFNIY